MIENLDNNTILICNSADKKKVLNYYYDNNKLIDFKIRELLLVSKFITIGISKIFVVIQDLLSLCIYSKLSISELKISPKLMQLMVPRFVIKLELSKLSKSLNCVKMPSISSHNVPFDNSKPIFLLKILQLPIKYLSYKFALNSA